MVDIDVGEGAGRGSCNGRAGVGACRGRGLQG